MDSKNGCVIIGEGLSRYSLFTIKIDMRTFIAMQRGSHIIGGWPTVFNWAVERIKSNQDEIKILTARGGEKEAVIVAVIDSAGIRLIRDGRKARVKTLLDG